MQTGPQTARRGCIVVHPADAMADPQPPHVLRRVSISVAVARRSTRFRRPARRLGRLCLPSLHLPAPGASEASAGPPEVAGKGPPRWGHAGAGDGSTSGGPPPRAGRDGHLALQGPGGRCSALDVPGGVKALLRTAHRSEAENGEQSGLGPYPALPRDFFGRLLYPLSGGASLPAPWLHSPPRGPAGAPWFQCRVGWCYSARLPGRPSSGGGLGR